MKLGQLDPETVPDCLFALVWSRFEAKRRADRAVLLDVLYETLFRGDQSDEDTGDANQSFAAMLDAVRPALDKNFPTASPGPTVEPGRGVPDVLRPLSVAAEVLNVTLEIFTVSTEGRRVSKNFVHDELEDGLRAGFLIDTNEDVYILYDSDWFDDYTIKTLSRASSESGQFTTVLEGLDLKRLPVHTPTGACSLKSSAEPSPLAIRRQFSLTPLGNETLVPNRARVELRAGEEDGSGIFWWDEAETEAQDEDEIAFVRGVTCEYCEKRCIFGAMERLGEGRFVHRTCRAR